MQNNFGTNIQGPADLQMNKACNINDYPVLSY